MFFSVSLSRVGTRFLFIDSNSWRRFERGRKILSRHSEKWEMDRFLHVEERGKNFPSRIDCFPRGESSASARVVAIREIFFFFFENSLANETGRRLSNSRYHLKQLKQKSSYVVRLFSSFFHPSAMVKIFFSRSVFQNTDGARSRKTIGLFSFYLWYDT